jgi:RNA polymerase sigma-70 factor (ECF subfamily)
MTAPSESDPDTLAREARRSWQGFLSVFQPLRPDLYRYCRYLTRSPWDAEDLAQDTLARAFVTLSRAGRPPANPRAWLFRVASNLWIDQARRERTVLTPTADEPEPLAEPNADPRATREAAGTLVSSLAPQERAAVVLKDVLELSLEEVAEALTTSVGAVKAALHRGRNKLVEPEVSAVKQPVPEALTAFCEAFNRRDIPRITELLLDHATIEVVGATIEGPTDGNILRGMLFGSQRMARADELGGIEAKWMQGVKPTSPRAEVAFYRGEPVLLYWYDHEDGEAVRAVNRIEVVDENPGRPRMRVASLRAPGRSLPIASGGRAFGPPMRRPSLPDARTRHCSPRRAPRAARCRPAAPLRRARGRRRSRGSCLTRRWHMGSSGA